MPLLSSLLTFETATGRTSIPPPTSHLLCTSTYPAPSNFLALHYARIFLANTEGEQRTGNDEKKVVLWIGCDGSGEAHHRNSLKRNGASFTKESFIYIDALEEILEGPTTSGNGFTQSAALQRLHTRIEEQLDAVSRYTEMDDEKEALHVSEKAPKCLVILDDASSLAWSITALDKVDEKESQGESQVDPRIQLLRSKRKGAIQNDAIGQTVARWIEESLRKSCDNNLAILLTHLTTESTTILPPAPHTQVGRSGGSYGVGTGFDADDAGEENEDEELYEDVEIPLEEEEANGSEDDKDVIKKNGTIENRYTSKSTFAKESVDWRVDTLLRRLLLDADFWIEVRGLRSGKARDCHGEISVHSLFRPSMALQQALPRLPLPLDPLRSLRSKDRISRPLATFNSLSINSTAAATSSMIPNKSWNVDVQCSGREGAMLFRVEATGEAVAWSRGRNRSAAVSN